MVKKIAISTDHGGFALKENLKRSLEKEGYMVLDEGTFTNESCDYPEYAYRVAKDVSVKKADRGITICKSGIGMSIVANKLPGVRAALCVSKKDAVSSRQHNDANVLVLASEKTGQKRSLDIVKTWLKTGALKGRHARRVRQIKKIDKKVFRKLK